MLVIVVVRPAPMGSGPLAYPPGPRPGVNDQASTSIGPPDARPAGLELAAVRAVAAGAPGRGRAGQLSATPLANRHGSVSHTGYVTRCSLAVSPPRTHPWCRYGPPPPRRIASFTQRATERSSTSRSIAGSRVLPPQPDRLGPLTRAQPAVTVLTGASLPGRPIARGGLVDPEPPCGASRATCAIGLPVSRTIRTAPSFGLPMEPPPCLHRHISLGRCLHAMRGSPVAVAVAAG